MVPWPVIVISIGVVLFFWFQQDMSYYDDPLHSTGALTTALATHASAVQGVGNWSLSFFIFLLSCIKLLFKL